MSYVDIGETIYNAVNDANTRLVDVFKYEDTSLENFPSAVIYKDSPGSISNYRDQRNFESTYNYIVRVYDKNKNRETMELRMSELIDQLLAALRQIPATCTIANLTLTVNWGRTEDEQPLRIADISVSAKKLDKI